MLQIMEKHNPRFALPLPYLSDESMEVVGGLEALLAVVRSVAQVLPRLGQGSLKRE